MRRGYKTFLAFWREGGGGLQGKIFFFFRETRSNKVPSIISLDYKLRKSRMSQHHPSHLLSIRT